jgi:chromosome segregation protein
MEGLRRRAAVAQERRRWLEAQAAGLREEIQHAQASLASLSERISAEEARLAAQAAAAEPEVSPGPAGHPQGGPAPADARQPLDVREAIWRSRTDSVVSGHSLLKHALEDLDRSLGLEREAHTTWSSQRERARAAHAAGAAGVRQGVERVESARDRLTAARAHVRTLEQERARLIERRSTLEGRLEALAARRKVTERLEQAARAGTLRGWHGRSGPAWRVAPAHRTAISAALGEFEDALAFASPEELDEAWTWIQADLAPTEAALLPLRPLKETEALPVPDDPDCLGLASDLVAAAAEYQPALRAMLGRTLIVRDADAARRLRGGLPPGGRLVTLQGEIYHPHGAVSLRRGADPHDADARLRQDLERTIAELNARTEDSTRLEAAAEARAAELAEAEAALARAHAAQTEAALEEQATLLHSQAARQRQEDLEARHTDLAGRLEASENELRLLAAVGNDIAHERAEFGAAGVAPLRPSAEARDAEVLRVAAAEARRRIDDLAEQVTALNSSLEDRKARLTKAGQQEQETVAELDQSEASLQTLSDRQDELKLETAPVESYLEEGEAARAKLEGEEGESRIALQRAEADAAQTLVEQARREEELSALQRRIEDDFGLVAYPYDESATGPEVLPLEGLVESLPVVEELPLELEGRVLRLRNQMRRMGAVNPEADREYQEVRERVEFLSSQTGDLRRAEQELREVIAELDELMEREFRRTFEAVATAFRAAFTRLFQGGSARLILSSPEDLSQSGIEIEARLPGKREQGLAMLSGGERSLTACALVFALLKVSPTPFCVLDEVDAMLDEANVTRFREILAELAADTQFIVITHNRETVQAAQTLYGVTMGPDSASQVISLRLEDAQRSIAA